MGFSSAQSVELLTKFPPEGKPPMAVSLDDLLLIIGSKEAEIFGLSKEITKLRSELNLLAAKALPTPANVLPFPVNHGKAD